MAEAFYADAAMPALAGHWAAGPELYD